ncbi:MAG: NADH:ubiquinone reductase (Na(+)-transporting) subunit C [Bacteroidota bacterium]
MKSNSNAYILFFVFLLTLVVAVVLGSLTEVTKAKAAQNEDIFNKRAILSSIEDKLGEDVKVKKLSDDEVLGLFSPENMDQVVLDMSGNVVEGKKAEEIKIRDEKKKPEAERLLPLYVYKGGDEPLYILSVVGNGLWDEIWGNIALESDVNTVAGAAFDHQGETPGLGAEIKDNPKFSANFKGKKIYRGSELVSIDVRKGGAKDPIYEVDGISGATVTADGVAEMLDRGIKYYEPYLEQIRKGGTSMLTQ